MLLHSVSENLALCEGHLSLPSPGAELGPAAALLLWGWMEDAVPGLGSRLSRAEGTEQDNVLNSHIQKKNSRCVLVPQGMVTTDLSV